MLNVWIRLEAISVNVELFEENNGCMKYIKTKLDMKKQIDDEPFIEGSSHISCMSTSPFSTK